MGRRRLASGSAGQPGEDQPRQLPALTHNPGGGGRTWWHVLLRIPRFVLPRSFPPELLLLTKSSKRAGSLPDKADVLAFIREQPGNVGTREIARAFGLKNAARAELKRMLRDLADEGAIEKRRRKLHHPGALPSTLLADVTARDRDGDLIATPDEWDEAQGAAPKIRIQIPRKARPGEAAGLGDRVLLRVEETDDDEGIRYRG